VYLVSNNASPLANQDNTANRQGTSLHELFIASMGLNQLQKNF